MHVNKSGTIYDVYVKNDRLYNKLYGQKSEPLDNSLEDYQNKLQASVSELKNVSSGDIQMHVLPESSSDKSSGSTENVEDDIIGIALHKYYYEADEVGLTSNNTKIDLLVDKKSLRAILDKIRFTYSKDEVLSKALDDNSSYKYQTTDIGNGYTSTSPDISSDPFKGTIAHLNEQLSFSSGMESIDPFKMMLDKMIEDMKKNNQDSLLKIGSPSTRLSSIFQSLQEEKQKTNQ